ncbi:MAG: M23 family metallopeptidase [Bacteroidetes bacterium]|nr:M23 family metallopeptidase [Bacteroidota bacterium]
MKTRHSSSRILYLASLICLILLTTCKKKTDDTQLQGNQQEIIRTISDVVTVNFPPGSVMTDNPVLAQVQDTSAVSSFNVIAPLFSVTGSLAYQISLNVGGHAPLTENITAAWTIPASFISSMPPNSKLSMFAMVYQDGGEEFMDNFIPIEAVFSESSSLLTASLPYYIFSDKRTADKTWTAILMVASVQDTTPYKMFPDSDPCGGANIACPIGNCNSSSISSPFTMNRLHPIQDEVKPHTGVDLRVADGSDVVAAADGTVEWIKVNYKKTWDDKPSGYGLYMIIRHDDGSATLYGHLSGTIFKVGERVMRGQVIALSGGVPGDPYSGGSTGPHLHFEYVPKGWILGSKNRIDPFPCISAEPALPVVQTYPAVNITSTSATSGGVVISAGGGTVSFRGVCWNTSGNPTVLENATFDGQGLGFFTSALSGLTPNTTYYLRAYATNETGTAYGNQESFKTTNAAGLDGLWTNGAIVLNFSGSEAAFSQVLSGMWLQALLQGWISIGTSKFTGITKTSATTWSCHELWWHTTDGTIDGVGYSSDGSITMQQDGSISTLSSNPWTGAPGTGTYVRQ